MTPILIQFLDFLRFVIIVYGLTNIVTTSYLFKPIRTRLKSFNTYLGEMIKCSMCFGYWAGVLISFLGVDPISHPNSILNLILSGFVGSAIGWLMIGESPDES